MKKKRSLGTVLLAVITVLTVVVNVACGRFAPILNSVLTANQSPPFWYLLLALGNAVVLSALVLFILNRIAFRENKPKWVGALLCALVIAVSLLLTWAVFLRGWSGEQHERPGSAPGTAAAPESGMELYDLADDWLGCHVYFNADNTYAITCDYTATAVGIETDLGTWERVSETELVLHSAKGSDIPVTLADGVWSCEVTDPNTGTVCHPKTKMAEESEAVETEPPAEESQPVETVYTVLYTDESGVVYASVETQDPTVVPEVDTPSREGYAFAGWQTRPGVTKDDLIWGVSPYEVPLGASSLYGGAGTAITDLESFDGEVLTLYARWAEITEIQSAKDLKAMADDLSGSYVLTGDIDLAGEDWTPIGRYFSNYEAVNAAYWTYAFHGSLDGAGYRITGLSIEGCDVDAAGYDESAAVWRNDGVSNGGETALFGAIASANIHDLIIEKPVIHVSSSDDATPYVAVVAGFDLGSRLTNITVNEPAIQVAVNDTDMSSRGSAWAAVSGLVAGGWSDTVTGCSVNDGTITLDVTSVKSHGGEYYAGGLMGECYSFLYGNTATVSIDVHVEDMSAAQEDAALSVYVGGAGGTNTTQEGSRIDAEISVSVKKPVGTSTVSIGGLTGSQRYQVAEGNTVNARIVTDCQLDGEAGHLYVGRMIGSTNIPYCIVQLIFAEKDSVSFSGCRGNVADVTHNGEPVEVNKGQALTVDGRELAYIANGDIDSGGTTYVSNIDTVIAEYGSAVPAAFLQRSVIVLVDE